MAHVPIDYPNVPEREMAEFLAVTRGEFPAGIADVVNFGNWWKGLPLAHHEIAWAGDVLRTSPIGRDDTHRLPFTVMDTSRFRGIVLIVDYQASNLPESGSDVTALASGVSISAVLKTTGGVNHDSGPAFAWELIAGTLPVRAVGRNVGGPINLFAADYWPMLQVTTGVALNTAPLNPTAPRPLLVQDTFAGGEMLIELTTVNVRILHVDVWALYQADV